VKRFALPLVLFALAAGASAQADLKKHFDGIYDELNEYVKAKRLDKAEKLFAKHGHPQFVYIHADGRRQTSKQMLAEMKASLAPQVKVTKSTSALGKLVVKGSTAKVDTTGEWVMVMPGPDGKSHTLGGVTKTTDTWLKTPSGWKLKEVKTVSEKMTLDGKPFKM
jgi:hypothetical protein